METETKNLPLAYQVTTFCQRIGIGRSTFYKLIQNGKLRTVTVGGRRLVPASEVDRLLGNKEGNADARS